MNRIRCAAVLAGGLSTRMGRDKALLTVEGEPLVRRTARTLESLFQNVIVVTNRAQVADAAQVPSVGDGHTNKGPLAGIEAALNYFGEATFIVACDLPYLSADLIEFQRQQWNPQWDALVAQSEDGIEPMHAIWAPSALSVVSVALEAPRPPSLRRLLRDLQVGTLTIEQARRFDAHLRCFENWNTPEDVEDV